MYGGSSCVQNLCIPQFTWNRSHTYWVMLHGFLQRNIVYPNMYGVMVLGNWVNSSDLNCFLDQKFAPGCFYPWWGKIKTGTSVVTPPPRKSKEIGYRRRTSSPEPQLWSLSYPTWLVFKAKLCIRKVDHRFSTSYFVSQYRNQLTLQCYCSSTWEALKDIFMRNLSWASWEIEYVKFEGELLFGYHLKVPGAEGG